MKKIIFIALLASTQLFSDCCDLYEHPNRVFIGGAYLHRRWHFYNNSQNTESLWGGTAGYEFLYPYYPYFRLTVTTNTGDAKQSVSLGSWYDHELQGEALVGYALGLGWQRALTITPYSGFGYFQDHQYNYGLRNPHFNEYITYAPVGMLLTWKVDTYFTIAARGQMNIELTRFLANPPQLAYNISKKPVWIGEIPLTLTLGMIDISLIPHYSFTPDSSYSFGTGDWGRIQEWGVRFETGFNW